MGKTGVHPELEKRLTALGARIAELREKTSKETGLEKVEEFGEIEDLERRHKMLEDELRRLNGEGADFRQDMKSEIEKVADDLTVTVENFVMWIDSGYQPDQRPKRPHNS